MIIGTGIDIVKIARIEKSISRFGDAFLERIFTHNEISYCKRRRNPAPSLAARFAAKEAMIKAAPEGTFVPLKDIEVVLSDSGKPSIKPGDTLGAVMERAGVRAIHLSLSHERDNAVAMVILEG